MSWAICPAATRVNQAYGCTSYDGEWADPNCPGGHAHTGIDLGDDNIFRKPVYSTRIGVVVQIGIEYLGPYAVCYHAFPDNVYIECGHLDSALVAVGDRVGIGTPLGLVGTRGNSNGPHLHVEVRTDGPYQSPPGPMILDPTPFLNYPAPPQEEPMTPSEKTALVRIAYATHLLRHPTPDDVNFWVPKIADDRSNIDWFFQKVQDGEEGKKVGAILLDIRRKGGLLQP